MDAFVLAAKLVLDSSEYDENLKDAEQNATNSGAIISTAFKSVAAAATAITGATAAISTAFIKSTGDVAAYGDNIDKMSQKMGMSAQAYQEWDAVMQHSGTSMETLKASMKTLANAAQTGSDAFKQLGISQEEIAKLSQEELFSRTITALQNVTDETQRTYLAGKTLGRGATELGALLNTSAEDTQKMKDRVHELGGVMSNEAVKAAAAYQDSLQDMTTAFDGLKRNMVSEFLPTVTTVMDGFTDLFAGDSEKGLGLINKGIQGFADNLTDVLPKVLDTGTKIVISLADAVTQNLPALLDAGANAAAELATGIVKNLPSVVDAGMEAVLSLADGISDNLPELIPAATNAITEIAQTLTDPDRLSELLEAGVNMIGAILEGVVQAVPQLVNAAIDAAGNLLSALPGLQGFGEFLKEHKELVEAAAAAWVVFKAATAIGNVISAATTAIGALRDGLAKLIVNLVAETDATAASTAAHLAHAAAIAGVAVAAAAVGAELVYYAKNIFDVSDGVKNLQKAQEDFNATLAAGHTSVDAELDQLQRKADKYEELRKVENRTEEQERQLKSLANELQTALGGEVQVVNSATGEYNDLTNAVNDYIEAKKREAMISVYQDKLKQAYEEMFKAEEAMEKRKEEFYNRGFNILDWNGKIAETSYRNDMIALNETKQKWEKTIDQISGDMESKLDEAKKDIDNSFNSLGDSIYAAEQRLASYAPAKFIPTEALRQQQGSAAPTFTLLPSLTKPIEDAANEGSRIITAASNAASSTAKKTLTFATKAIGEYKDLGVVKELGKALSETEEEADKIASTVWSKSQEVFNRSITNNQLSLSDQVKGWEIIRDQFVVNSDQWIAANDKVIASQRKLEEENQKTAENMSNSIADAYKTMQENVASLQNEYQQALSDRADEIMNQFGLFDEVPQSIQISGEQLMKNLNEQVNATRKFYSDIEKLSERGVSDELVESIRAMGVKAGDELDAILDMTDEQLAEYDSKFKEKKELSTGFAEEQLEPLKEETQKKIDEEVKNYGTQVAALAVDYGVEFMTGMSEGIKTGAETVVADAKDAVNTAWKEAFGTTDMTSIGTIAPELTSNATVNNDNKFTFNINGIQYQTITQLAKAVANEMQFLTNRRKAGYAGT